MFDVNNLRPRCFKLNCLKPCRYHCICKDNICIDHITSHSQCCHNQSLSDISIKIADNSNATAFCSSLINLFQLSKSNLINNHTNLVDLLFITLSEQIKKIDDNISYLISITQELYQNKTFPEFISQVYLETI